MNTPYENNTLWEKIVNVYNNIKAFCCNLFGHYWLYSLTKPFGTVIACKRCEKIAFSRDIDKGGKIYIYGKVPYNIRNLK